ncbi:MAG: hypothetical protein IJZ56_03105 [Oscillospiraceae bacterium]|nr:hypothetical protein [Oscillospiraceae bacterium]
MKLTSIRLSGNQLKLIALICMTADHMGLILLPQYPILRLIGRLSFPIFAYMIAEGCRYTRSMGKYLASISAVAALCQLIYFVVLGSASMCIMVTFSLSVGLCWLLRTAREKKSFLWAALALAGIGAVFFLTDILPTWLQDTDYLIDYGFLGVMLPVVIYLLKGKKAQLAGMFAMLCLLALWANWNLQWFSLLALPLLALYGGHRGKWKLKWLFYVYYPLHLGALWMLRVLLLYLI